MKGREIRCFDYVNRPYDDVREVLTRDAPSVFQAATKAAAARAETVAAELRTEIGGIGVSADVQIHVRQIEDNSSDRLATPTTRLQVEWEAVSAPGLFPLMKADLFLYSLTATETQLDFWGFYEPPLGVVGKAVNALVGHRIAEASVHRFLSEVAEYLRQTVPARDRAAAKGPA